MKKKMSGFTQVIILLGFLVLFAASMFPSPTTDVKKAKKTQTLNDAMGLQTAIERYYNEYEKLPDLGTAGEEIPSDGVVGVRLLEILLGKEAVSDQMQNPRQIVFFNSKVSMSRAKGGLVYSSGGSSANPEGYYDAWGNPFHIKLDSNYDQEIMDPLIARAIVRNKIAIVYSYGPDGVIGSKGKTGIGDDIKTW